MAKPLARAKRDMPLVDNWFGSDVAHRISPPGHMQNVVTLPTCLVGGRLTKLYSAAPNKCLGNRQAYCPASINCWSCSIRQPIWKPLARWAIPRFAKRTITSRALWPMAISTIGPSMRSPVDNSTPAQRPCFSTISTTCAFHWNRPPQPSIRWRRRLHICGSKSLPMCGWWRNKICRGARASTKASSKKRMRRSLARVYNLPSL